jgi:pSer/pThr/pTyr-binding forkhead associated (FHA) protein
MLALRVLGRVIPVPREGVLLGREAPAVRDLPGMADLHHVGRQHAQVYWGNDGLEVIDLRSMNGTFLDGRQIVAPERLRPGQTLGLAGDLDIDVIELDEFGRPEVRSDG